MKKLHVRRRLDVAVLAGPTSARYDVPLESGEIGVLAVDASPRGAVTESLSAAELEVAGHVVRGLSNEQIAQTRGVSLHTVANQLRSIYEKLGITNRSQLAHAMTRGAEP